MRFDLLALARELEEVDAQLAKQVGEQARARFRAAARAGFQNPSGYLEQTIRSRTYLGGVSVGTEVKYSRIHNMAKGAVKIRAHSRRGRPVSEYRRQVKRVVFISAELVELLFPQWERARMQQMEAVLERHLANLR